MIGIALQFLTGGFTKALAWITASARNILIVALVASLAWGWVGWHGKAKSDRVLASTVTAWKAAEREATAAQIALNARQVATNEAVNKGSTDANTKGLDAARSAVAAYARLHPAPRCAASGTAPAAVPVDPGLDAGPGPDPGMVAVTIEDVNTLAAGTVRAESCRAWAAAMISAGLAEAD
jgi:hypothetical protein